MKEYIQRYTSEITNTFLVIIHASAILSGSIAINFSTPRYFGFFSAVFIGLIAFDLIYFSQNSLAVDFNMDWIEYKLVLSLIFISISIVSLVNTGVYFYISMTLVVLCFLFVLNRNPPNKTAVLIIAAVSITAIGAQVLSVHYYAPTADDVWHTSFVRDVAVSGTTDNIEIGRYRLVLPTFHILSSIIVQIAQLESRAAVESLFIFGFPIASLALFSIWSNFVDQKTDLIALALVAINPFFIHWGSKSHPQSLSFIFFILILLLLSKKGRNRNIIYPFLLLMIAWFTTHHLSVFMGVGIISLLYGLPTLLTNQSKAPILSTRKPDSFGYYFILLCGMILYWVILTNLYKQPVAWFFGYSPSAQGETTHLLQTFYSSKQRLIIESIPYILDNVHYGLLGALVAVNLVGLFKEKYNSSTSTLWMILSGGLFSSLIYFPNPIWIVLRGVGLLLRWTIMVFPFVCILAAIKMPQYIFNRKGDTNALYVIVVFLLIFSSIGTGISDPSIVDIGGYDKEPKRYFTSDEISAMDFSIKYVDNGTVIAPSLLPTYIETSNSNPKLDSQRIRVSEEGGVINPNRNILIYSETEAKRTSKFTIQTPNDFRKTGAFAPNKVTWNVHESNKVFSNGDSHIFRGR